MDNPTFACMGCDSRMKFQEFGGAVIGTHKTWNDQAIFILCRQCYQNQNRPSANALFERLKLLQKSKMRHRCAFTTSNIIALNGGSLECALKYGHENTRLLRVLARTDSFILLP